MKTPIYGLMAEFADPTTLVAFAIGVERKKALIR